MHKKQCQRCGRQAYDVGQILDGICGNCADDLRSEQQAQQDQDRMAERHESEYEQRP